MKGQKIKKRQKQRKLNGQEDNGAIVKSRQERIDYIIEIEIKHGKRTKERELVGLKGKEEQMMDAIEMTKEIKNKNDSQRG